ncbi:guanylin [Ahaetulla prasina]|uniref:guanylin n=1 Tax=Ahaetulla prasina TaxID=499056 RepID=UPI002646FC47|nr:guanylin [Ahaetulla prasina]
MKSSLVLILGLCLLPALAESITVQSKVSVVCLPRLRKSQKRGSAMKSSLVLILGLCLLPALAESITVQVQNLSFSWDSVKALKKVLDAAPPKPRFRNRGPEPVCLHPELPSEFVPLCSMPKAYDVFQTLDTIASDPETCEICFNIACSGC